MNKNFYKSLLLAFFGVMTASTVLTSCELQAPEIPPEELYIRGFIKKYGLIDPNQDFSSVRESEVTVQLPGLTKILNVYAKVGDTYYRVGAFADVDGELTVPVDIASATDLLMIEADNARYYTVPGGTVRVLSSDGMPSSRALEPSAYNVADLWVDPTTWTTGIVEINSAGVMQGGNYIDVVAKGVVGSKLKPSVVDVHLGDHADKSGNYEIGNTVEGSNVRFLIDNKNETMSSYLFTMRTASRNNAKVRVLLLGKPEYQSEVGIFLDRTLTIEGNRLPGKPYTGTYNTSTGYSNGEYGVPDGVTVWELRTEQLPKGKYELVLIGVEAIPNDDDQCYSGNWGFINFAKAKTIDDMAWIMACEDLGTTDDFDFNDIVIRIESVNTNSAYLNLGVNQWQVVEDKEHKFLLSAPERKDSRAGEPVQTHLRVTSLAAGGMLPLWLHFRMPAGANEGKDYILFHNKGGGNNVLNLVNSVKGAEAANENNEWHRWFGCNNHSLMINTGYNEPMTGTIVEFVAEGFSMAKYSYIQYAHTDGKPNSATDDPWAKLVEEWQWMMQNPDRDYLKGFFITVYDPDPSDAKATILGKNLAGLPPQMLMFPDVNPMISSGHDERTFGWEWPIERVDITDVYPNFMSWIEDNNRLDGYEWFMYPKPGILDMDNLRYSRDPKHPQAPFRRQTITAAMTQAEADAILNTED